MTDLIQMLVLSSVAISCGLLSPFLVLKKMTMFANSLSHTILLGIALAFLIGGGAFFDVTNLLIGALIAAFFTAFLTGSLVRFFHLSEDASIGLVFTSLFALGIVIVTVFMRDVHIGIEAVMGNADILQLKDLQLALPFMLINLSAVILFYKQFQLLSFDPNGAKTLKMGGNFFHFLLLFLTAATCISAFRAVGVLLVLSFLVGPFLIARRFSHRLPQLLFLTPCIGVFAAISGVFLSRLVFNLWDLPLSTGGMTASLIGLFYFFAVQGKRRGEKRASRWP